jgi:MarR family transcriptional regulator, organic hydroperoxide resistance regulator
MLKNMEEKGLIIRKPDLQDKRSVRIFLTPEGKRKKEISVKTIKEFNEEVYEKVGKEELTRFFKVFEKINQVVENFQSSTINPQTTIEIRD